MEKRGKTLMNEHALGASGGIIACICAAAVGSWEVVVVLFAAYALALFGNLLTGIMYAQQSGTYSTEKAKYATYQKGAMIGGIIVVALLDILLMGTARFVGFDYNVPFLVCLLAGYAAVHELSSMISNLKKLGNHVPAKLEDVVKDAEDALNQGKIPKFPAENGGDSE